MILADSSIWIEHFRRGVPALAKLLEIDEIAIHPSVIGELACGNLAHREETLEWLTLLPSAPAAMDGEVLKMIQRRQFWGKGLGWIDVHLLASTLLGHHHIWTLDRRLHESASILNVAYQAK